MGTRHLICIMKDGEYKLAQYGQWDGYPSGQGVDILAFLRKSNLQHFSENVSELSFSTDEEIEKAWVDCGADDSGYVTFEIAEKVKNMHPEISRDCGADILILIRDGIPEDLMLKNSLDFAKNSLFCEWVYVIDLDKNTLEVYQGFNQEPLSSDERFYFDGKPDEDGYYPVRKVGAYFLSSLPTKTKFLKDLERDEE